jgi:hypothetical protein
VVIRLLGGRDDAASRIRVKELIRSGLADPSSAVRAKAIWEIGDSVFGYIRVTNAKMGLIEINRNLSACFQHLRDASALVFLNRQFSFAIVLRVRA